jgi:glycosyltransferase involved in cell wall biosynthesis
VLHSADIHLLSRLPGRSQLAAAIARGADVLWFVSEAQAKRFHALLPQRTPLPRTLICPMGIELPEHEVFAGDTRVEFRRRHQLHGYCVLLLGRHVSIKGYDVALRAAALSSDITLLIAGDGPMRATWMRQAQTLGARVRWLGHVFGAEKQRWLRAADAFALPSRTLENGRSEGLPCALLEALDPEQNNAFVDHYLNVPIDLSQILFIATANRKDTIPRPLLDRMEVIDIPGYTRDDKLAIAQSFLIPRQLSDHGLTPDHLEFTDSALERLVNEYTAESGVRHLAQQVAAICRAVAVRVASGDTRHIDADGKFVETVLGAPKYELDIAEKVPAPGIATTLVWTPGGGEIMLVECTQMPGKGEVQLTGKMGDVLKESAAAAFSYIRARASSFALKEDFLNRVDVHVHLPKGAVPKDGPAMGLSLFLALISMLRGVALRPDVAVTGEITLRGKVLRVDGLKQKCLAAHRAGIKDVVLPKANEPDLDEVPDRIRNDLRIHFVSRVDEVLGLALVEPLTRGSGAAAAPAHA